MNLYKYELLKTEAYTIKSMLEWLFNDFYSRLLYSYLDWKQYKNIYNRFDSFRSLTLTSSHLRLYLFLLLRAWCFYFSLAVGTLVVDNQPLLQTAEVKEMSTFKVIDFFMFGELSVADRTQLLLLFLWNKYLSWKWVNFFLCHSLHFLWGSFFSHHLLQKYLEILTYVYSWASDVVNSLPIE